MKFSEFLNEKAQHKLSISTEDAIEIAKKHCRNAIKRNITLYRGANGFDDDTSYLLDSTKTVRRSANTSNHYTLSLDTLIKDPLFPKRSTSFIMSTDSDMAEQYGLTLRIIPYDDAKIGCTNEEDIWYVNVNSDKLKHFTFEEFNGVLEDLNVSDKDFESMVKDIGKALIDVRKRVEIDPDDVDRSGEDLLKLFDGVEPTDKEIVDRLVELFDPKKINFTFQTGATAKDLNGECWLSGQCLALTDEAYEEVIKAVKES